MRETYRILGLRQPPRTLWTCGVLTLLVAAPASTTNAVEFLRGDVNNDGAVSVADAHSLINWLFEGKSPPTCLSAADANASAQVNLTDIVLITHVALGQGAPLPAPFPDPGPDPDPQLSCETYGGGSPLEDPGASLEILEAVAPGGDDASALITLGISSSTSLAGYSGTLTIEGGVLVDGDGGDGGGFTDLSGGLTQNGVGRFFVLEGELRFLFLSSMNGQGVLPASDAVTPVAVIEICLQEGTEEGTYAIRLETPELADKESGRAIRPDASSATLIVESDLVPGTGCSFEPVDPPEPPPPVDEIPNFNTVYRLGEASGVPGGSAEMPFFVQADGHIQGFQFSIDFDEKVLLGTSIETFYRVASDPLQPRGFESYDIVNDRDDFEFGGDGEDGVLSGSIVFDLLTDDYVLPAGQEHHVMTFHFDVRETAQTGSSSEVQFVDGLTGRGNPVANVVVSHGKQWTPDSADSFVFVNGFLNIIDEISVFRRGDSNSDEDVDISDAQFTLNHLFSSGDRPSCLDAADANDDGYVDVSDPIATLNYFFSSGPPLPEPFMSPGVDPTPDELGCHRGLE